MAGISVVLAAYNGAPYIERQLRTLMEQTRRIDEVIIRDDASTDETVRIAERFIRKNRLDGWRVIAAAQNAGYFENFHQAIMLARGDVIFLCDQDDLWDARKVERCMEVLAENPQLTLVCTGYDTIDSMDRPCGAPGVRFVDRRFDGRLELLAADSFIGCSYIRGFSIAFRAPLRDRVPWKNPGRLLSHDWLLCLCAGVMEKDALAQPRCGFLHENLAHYRVHAENVTARARSGGMIETAVRVKALADSRAAHEMVLNAFLSRKSTLSKREGVFVQRMRRQIAFEGKRLQFMESKNPLRFLALTGSVCMYRCYYHSFWGGLRVWAGDWIYTYRRK